MIYVNEIPSAYDPLVCRKVYDHRISKIELIDDVTVQDLGHVEGGDAFFVACPFTPEKYDELEAVANEGGTVTFTDPWGKEHSNLKLIMRKWCYCPSYPDCVIAIFELWNNSSGGHKEPWE